MYVNACVKCIVWLRKTEHNTEKISTSFFIVKNFSLTTPEFYHKLPMVKFPELQYVLIEDQAHVASYADT